MVLSRLYRGFIVVKLVRKKYTIIKISFHLLTLQSIDLLSAEDMDFTVTKDFLSGRVGFV